VNVPGTIAEHPNWRRRLPVALEDLRAYAGLASLAETLSLHGRGAKSERDRAKG